MRKLSPEGTYSSDARLFKDVQDLDIRGHSEFREFLSLLRRVDADPMQINTKSKRFGALLNRIDADLRRRILESPPERSSALIGMIVGGSISRVEKCRKVIDHGDEDLARDLARGRISLPNALRVLSENQALGEELELPTVQDIVLQKRVQQAIAILLKGDRTTEYLLNDEHAWCIRTLIELLHDKRVLTASQKAALEASLTRKFKERS